MLLKAYELITKLQNEIGNDAQVSLSARDGRLFVRVHWMKKDFHAQHQFADIELAQVADDSLPITYLVEWCKKEYARKVGAG